MKKYTKSHEWIALEGDVGTVGVSDHAQKELGDVVYVELPEVGQEVSGGDDVVVLESTKAAADVYTPASGEIIEVNEELNNSSDLINSSAEEKGWLFKIRVANSSELDALMSEEEYLAQM